KAETIPPTNGGIATITVSLLKKSNPIVNRNIAAPKTPARAIRIVFHCIFNSLTDNKVPIFVINNNIIIVATTGGIPAISTISFGKKVQYPNRNKRAQIKTEGIQALVLIDIKSPINKIAVKMTKANNCDK